MTKLDNIKIKISTIQQELQYIEGYVKQFDATKTSINRLKTRQQSLSELKDKFEEVQLEYEILDSKNEEAANHLERRLAFKNTYCNLMADILDIINSFDKESNHENSRNVGVHNQELSLKLPVINLPTFVGNYKHWSNFENSFKSVIDENKCLNNRQKLQYLKSCLREDALRAVESLSIEEANYSKAWEILERRFKNTRLIVQDHVSSILNAQLISTQSYSLLRELLDKVVTNMEALKSLKINVDSWDALLIPIISEKLDYNSKKEWQMSLDTTVPTYQQFISFLEKRCTVLESLDNITNKTSNQAPIIQINKRNNQTQNRSISLTTVENKPNTLCSYCKNPKHNILTCTEFLNLSITSRIEKAQYLKLCINCLRNNHKTGSCRSTSTCRLCNKRHHTLLHNNKNDSNIESNADAQVVLANHSARPKPNINVVLLATAIVKIKNHKNQYEPCRVFLDTGSMSNCITKKMATKLGIKRHNEQFEMKGLNGTVSSSTESILVDIKSNHNNFALKQVKCIIVNKITEKLP